MHETGNKTVPGTDWVLVCFHCAYNGEPNTAENPMCPQCGRRMRVVGLNYIQPTDSGGHPVDVNNPPTTLLFEPQHKYCEQCGTCIYCYAGSSCYYGGIH